MWEDEQVSATHPGFTEHLPNARIQCYTESDFEKVTCLAGHTDVGNKSLHCTPAEEEGNYYLGGQGDLYGRGEC